MVEDELVLRYAWRDQVWAEWIQSVLAGARIRAIDPTGSADAATNPIPGATAQRLIIFSPASRRAMSSPLRTMARFGYRWRSTSRTCIRCRTYR